MGVAVSLFFTIIIYELTMIVYFLSTANTSLFKKKLRVLKKIEKTTNKRKH